MLGNKTSPQAHGNFHGKKVFNVGRSAQAAFVAAKKNTRCARTINCM